MAVEMPKDYCVCFPGSIIEGRRNQEATEAPKSKFPSWQYYFPRFPEKHIPLSTVWYERYHIEVTQRTTIDVYSVNNIRLWRIEQYLRRMGRRLPGTLTENYLNFDKLSRRVV